MARKSRRGPDEDGMALWRQVTRGVRRLVQPAAPPSGEPPRRDARVGPMAEEPTKPAPRPPGAPRPETSSFGAPAMPGGTPGLDRRSAERLRRGRLPIEARLDLHGMTQAAAHQALSAFLIRNQAAGRRCVLVVTGKGALGTGVLRREVPRWLREPANRDRVLAVAPAQPKDGGAGALYVLLRRLRGEAR